MKSLRKYLSGGDLRSIADAHTVVSLIHTQKDFDELFQYLLTNDRLIVMRAADAIEKITLRKPEYLTGHNQDIINVLERAIDKELKWHVALIASRLDVTKRELHIIWNTLQQWAKDKNESKIVRVNAIQALFDIANQNTELKADFQNIIKTVAAENVPSIHARLKKLQ